MRSVYRIRADVGVDDGSKGCEEKKVGGQSGDTTEGDGSVPSPKEDVPSPKRNVPSPNIDKSDGCCSSKEDSISVVNDESSVGCNPAASGDSAEGSYCSEWVDEHLVKWTSSPYDLCTW